jgi:hypothetical protein
LTHHSSLKVSVDAILRETGPPPRLHQHIGGKEGTITAVLPQPATDQEAR